MSTRVVKQQLAAFLAAGGGGVEKSRGKKGGAKPLGKRKAATDGASNEQSSSKRRKEKRRKAKARAAKAAALESGETTREKNLRLLKATSDPTSESEKLLNRLTGTPVAVEESDGGDSDLNDFADLF